MSCNITTGIAKGCNTNIGGVKNVYLGNSVNGPWYLYEMDKGTASLVETYDINQAGGIVGYTQALTMQLNKMSADKQLQIDKIAEANGMVVLVETNTGQGFLFGDARGAYLASGTSTSGTAYSDANQSELVIQAHSKQPMVPKLPGQIIGTLFLDVALTQVEELGICNFYPTPAPNGYLQYNNVITDTYSAWSQYQCDELWGGQGAPLDVTKDVTLAGDFTLRVDAGTTQTDWDVVYGSQLGVNTSRTGNYPGRGDEQTIMLNMSQWVPATLPQVGYTKTIPYSINLGKFNYGNLNNQDFGVMLINPVGSQVLTGPWTANIKQIGGELKAYLS